jgi:PQQ-dependent catabolism-associated CXXCW motif protein
MKPWASVRGSRLILRAMCSAWIVAPAPALSNDAQALFSPEGYRLAELRSAVPASLPGTRVVSTEDVKAMLSDPGSRLVLVDVLPAPPRPDGLPASTLWLPPDRHNLPGSAWLPNVGYGRLSDALDAYFRDNLERLTDGDRHRPVLIYCLADCWMSWNAAKRATEEYGYTQVYWYPEGTTGWEAAGLPLQKNDAVPMD